MKREEIDRLGELNFELKKLEVMRHDTERWVLLDSTPNEFRGEFGTTAYELSVVSYVMSKEMTQKMKDAVRERIEEIRAEIDAA